MENELNNVETNDVATQPANDAEQQSGRFYTDEEIAMLEQKAGDKRITQYQKTLVKKEREAAKLSKMSEEDKRNYELDKREQELEEKERIIALYEMKNTASKILAEKGISLSLVDFVVNEDGETTNANINLLEKAFKESVKQEVEKRLASKVPTKSLPLTNEITKDDFRKMSVVDLMRLKEEQPELYAELKG